MHAHHVQRFTITTTASYLALWYVARGVGGLFHVFIFKLFPLWLFLLYLIRANIFNKLKLEIMLRTE